MPFSQCFFLLDLQISRSLAVSGNIRKQPLNSGFNSVVVRSFLGGGNSNILFVFTPIWGRFPIWRAYFSNWVETTNQFGCDSGSYLKDTWYGILADSAVSSIADLARHFSRSYGSKGGTTQHSKWFWRSKLLVDSSNSCLIFVVSFSFWST